MPRIIYKDSKGNRLKGVTTIINEIWPYMKVKNMLDWACKLAMNYENGLHLPIYHEWERDRAGRIGTLSHALVGAYITKDVVFLDEHEETLEALRIFYIFKEWIDENVGNIYYQEYSMVDEKYQYGGTPDFIGKLKNGTTVILDWKTGFVDDITCLYQLAAYYNLAMVNHPEINIDKGIIVGLNREKTKIKLTEYSVEEMLAGFDGFWHYLKAHHNRVKIEKMRKEAKNE